MFCKLEVIEFERDFNGSRWRGAAGTGRQVSSGIFNSNWTRIAPALLASFYT